MKFYTENGMHVAVAENGMVIDCGDGYCHKLYRKVNDFSHCTEVDAVAAASDEELTDAEALEILLGGAV